MNIYQLKEYPGWDTVLKAQEEGGGEDYLEKKDVCDTFVNIN